MVSFITESLKCLVNVSQLKVRNKILLLNPKQERLGRFYVFFQAFTASGFFLGHQWNIFICFAQVLNENGVISFGLITPVLKVMLKKKKTALKHNNYSICRNTEINKQ